MIIVCNVIFFVYGCGHHRALHVLTLAFPTRRSSYLADPRSRSEAGGAAGRPPDVGNGDRRGVLALDPIVARPAGADQPMGERGALGNARSEEHTSELQSLMRISYAVFCLKKKSNHDHLTLYVSFDP